MISFENDIEACLKILTAGGIILYPTDTIWGIGCDATNALAVDKIYQLKKRQEEKSLIIMLAEEKDLIHYVTQPDFGVFDFLKTATKPTTVIYDGATNLAANTINIDGTIAIRFTKDLFCNHLIKIFKKPIVSTSANIAGSPSPATFKDIDMAIKNGVDYIVTHRREEALITEPSTIIKWNTNGSYSIIRK